MGNRVPDLLNSFEAISRLLESNLHLKEIAPVILSELGRSLSCEWGTYWKVSEQRKQLIPFAKWAIPNFSAPDLDLDTQFRSLSINEGTAGHVWRSRKPVWTLDLARDMCLPRSLDAYKSGLTGGIWFALKTEDAVFGVIELLGRHITPLDDRQIVELEHFGIRLGYLLKNRPAEIPSEEGHY